MSGCLEDDLTGFVHSFFECRDVVLEAVFGTSDPINADRFGQLQPCDQVLRAVAIFFSLNDEDGPTDVCEVAEPVPVAAFLLKRVAENDTACCSCSVENFGHDGSPQ